MFNLHLNVPDSFDRNEILCYTAIYHDKEGQPIMTTVQLNFRLPEDLKRDAQHVAVERGESLSKVIRAALRDYVDRSSERTKQVIRQLKAERMPNDRAG